jgi:cyclase
MVPPTTRRNFLRAALGGAAGMALPLSALGRRAALTATPLGDNVLLIGGAGANVVAILSLDGCALVDGGAADHSADLLKLVYERAQTRRIETLFNTHWHWDHTGSNERLSKAGAKIVAHENTKLWLGAEIIVEWENRTYPPRPPQALPNQTFYTSDKMQLGQQSIEYAHVPQAHTDGDMYVFLPSQNILVVGDLLAVDRYPIVDYCTGGWIGGFIDATKALLERSDAQTRIVAGQGPVRARADLENQLTMCNAVKDRVAAMIRRGLSIEEVIAEKPTAEFDGQRGDPQLFLTLVYRGALGHIRELGGVV